MAKQNRPGAQKADSDNTQAEKQQQIQPASSASSTSKGKSGAKSRKPTIGGTAVQGAKSTQPKELSTATPVNRQPEYYNREMRRRMRQMGTGPYSERPVIDPRERRRKRQERVRHIADVRGPSRDIKLGRRNTYFLIGIVALIALLIVVGLIINHVL